MKNYIYYHIDKDLYGPNNVVRFEKGYITAIVEGNNEAELDKLFWQVYADSCAYNIIGLMNILTAEKRIIGYSHTFNVNNDLINFLAYKEDGLISKMVDCKYNDYPKPRISKYKIYPSLFEQMSYLGKKISPSFIKNDSISSKSKTDNTFKIPNTLSSLLNTDEISNKQKSISSKIFYFLPFKKNQNIIPRKRCLTEHSKNDANINNLKRTNNKKKLINKKKL